MIREEACPLYNHVLEIWQIYKTEAPGKNHPGMGPPNLAHYSRTLTCAIEAAERSDLQEALEME